jgi:hypothetical protein
MKCFAIVQTEFRVLKRPDPETGDRSEPEPEPENETDDETVENCESRFVKERKPIFVSESQTGYVN